MARHAWVAVCCTCFYDPASTAGVCCPHAVLFTPVSRFVTYEVCLGASPGVFFTATSVRHPRLWFCVQHRCFSHAGRCGMMVRYGKSNVHVLVLGRVLR